MEHKDTQDFLSSFGLTNHWFTAYLHNDEENSRTSWFSALIDPLLIEAKLLNSNWDIQPIECRPSIWVYHDKKGQREVIYNRFGNDDDIEQLVLYREFNGTRDDFIELNQEFTLYHNLYHEANKKRYLVIDSEGTESEAVRYGTNFLEIRTDLLIKFCSAKKMALAIYVDSYGYSKISLKELGKTEIHSTFRDNTSAYDIAVVDEIFLGDGYETVGGIHGKKYIQPIPYSLDENQSEKLNYQEFIIGSDASEQYNKHTCDPSKLANFFGKNPDAPNYLTPVFFRPDVLTKYYADPDKYSVEDGILRCGSLWGLQIDNDHANYIVAWLGDLGRDLPSNERNYWLSYNIPPLGRKISETNFSRSFLAEATATKKYDLVFKQEYSSFTNDFFKAKGWHFFLPLHKADEHFFTSLHALFKDSQSEFDTQLLALTKILIDSLNEKQISNGLKALSEKDKGITKLEKYFIQLGFKDFDIHIKFLRVLQDLRSSSAAHRKGNTYIKIIKELQMEDVGQQKVFYDLLVQATNLLGYLRDNLLKK